MESLTSYQQPFAFFPLRFPCPKGLSAILSRASRDLGLHQRLTTWPQREWQRWKLVSTVVTCDNRRIASEKKELFQQLKMTDESRKSLRAIKVGKSPNTETFFWTSHIFKQQVHAHTSHLEFQIFKAKLTFCDLEQRQKEPKCSYFCRTLWCNGNKKTPNACLLSPQQPKSRMLPALGHGLGQGKHRSLKLTCAKHFSAALVPPWLFEGHQLTRRPKDPLGKVRKKV